MRRSGRRAVLPPAGPAGARQKGAAREREQRAVQHGARRAVGSATPPANEQRHAQVLMASAVPPRARAAGATPRRGARGRRAQTRPFGEWRPCVSGRRPGPAARARNCGPCRRPAARGTGRPVLAGTRASLRRAAERGRACAPPRVSGTRLRPALRPCVGAG